MEENEILTPHYWNRPEYQPLIETETVYGHIIKIPAHWLEALSWMKQNRSQQGLVDSLQDLIVHGHRGYQATDFAKVLLEIYQPRIPETPIQQDDE